MLVDYVKRANPERNNLFSWILTPKVDYLPKFLPKPILSLFTHFQLIAEFLNSTLFSSLGYIFFQTLKCIINLCFSVSVT